MIGMESDISYYDIKTLVYPALKCKMKELHSFGYYYITQDDIWDLLLENIWDDVEKIELCDLVNDILNSNNEKLYNLYIEKKVNK